MISPRSTGANGTNGTNGVDGEVLFQVAEGYIQWQYAGDLTWNNLIDLADHGPMEQMVQTVLMVEKYSKSQKVIFSGNMPEILHGPI